MRIRRQDPVDMTGVEFALYPLIALGQIEAFRFIPGVTVYVHDLVVALLVMSVLVNSEKRKIAFCAPLTKPIIILSGVLAVSLFLNAYRVTQFEFLISAGYLVRFVFYAGLYWYAVSSKRGAGIVSWLFVAGTAVSFLGLMQLLLYPDLRNLYYQGWDPHYYRVFSTFLDPNFTGLFCVLTLFLGIYILSHDAGNRLIQVSFIVNVAALLFTYSRSSYLALFAGLSVFSLLTRRIRMIGIALAFFAVFFIIPKPDIVGFNLLRTETVFSRIGNFSDAIRLFQKSPVLGYGFDTLRYSTGLPAEVGIVSHARSGLDNSLMFLLVTGGLVGMAAFVYLVFRLVAAILRLRDTRMKHILLASVIAVSVHGLFVNSLFYPFILIWIFLVLGSAENANATEKRGR